MSALHLLLAAAGGGSSSFGGGGGGGGGGGSEGGGTYGDGGWGFGFSGVNLIYTLFAAFGLVILLFGSMGWLRDAFHIRQRDGASRSDSLLLALRGAWSWHYRAVRVAIAVPRRDRAIRAALVEAAQDDPAYEPATLELAAQRLFREVQRLWDANDVDGMRGVVNKKLLTEWKLRLKDFERHGWHNVVETHGPPRVRFVALRNVEGDAEDRVVVHYTAKITDYVEGGARWRNPIDWRRSRRLREIWTLGHRGGSWTVLSTESEWEGMHHLREAVVASPGSSLGAGDEDDVEAAVTEILAGWCEAVDIDTARLRARVSDEVADAMLEAGPKRRVVVRGLHARHIWVQHRDERCAMVGVEVGGIRYVEDRDTLAVVDGDPDRSTRFTEMWELRREDGGSWRLVAAQVAAAW